jgi:hypothetical protein
MLEIADEQVRGGIGDDNPGPPRMHAERVPPLESDQQATLDADPPRLERNPEIRDFRRVHRRGTRVDSVPALAENAGSRGVPFHELVSLAGSQCEDPLTPTGSRIVAVEGETGLGRDPAPRSNQVTRKRTIERRRSGWDEESRECQ